MRWKDVAREKPVRVATQTPKDREPPGHTTDGWAVDEVTSPWHQNTRHSPSEEQQLVRDLEQLLYQCHAHRDRVKLRQLIKIVNQRGIESAVRYWNDKVHSKNLKYKVLGCLLRRGYNSYGEHPDDAPSQP